LRIADCELVIMKRSLIAPLFLIVALVPAASALAQAPLPTAAPPPSYASQELDRIVSPIALYPDPLLAQVLAAATYSSEIPDAAAWADTHHYLTDGRLTQAIAEDRLPWDPSVQALLPFPSVLGTMAGNMPWTEELGNAFLADQAGVMDAVQRMRHEAERFGYLQSTPDITVTGGTFIEIAPVDPYYIQVPYYDPLVVFAPPRPGLNVATAVRFGFGVRIGDAFERWGWGGSTHLVWPSHTLMINRTPWQRTWTNRTTYVHPYTVPRYAGQQPLERHHLQPRTAHDRGEDTAPTHH
jgi:Protein of unknown function (DUF3300)